MKKQNEIESFKVIEEHLKKSRDLSVKIESLILEEKKSKALDNYNLINSLMVNLSKVIYVHNKFVDEMDEIINPEDIKIAMEENIQFWIKFEENNQI